MRAASALVLVLRPRSAMRVVRRVVAVLGRRGLRAARMARVEVGVARAAAQVAMWCWSA